MCKNIEISSNTFKFCVLIVKQFKDESMLKISLYCLLHLLIYSTIIYQSNCNHTVMDGKK